MKTPPIRQPNTKETELVCVQLLLKELVGMQLLQLKELVCIQLLQFKEQFKELVCVQLVFKLVSWGMQLLLFKESVYGGHVVSASKIRFVNLKKGVEIESQNSKQARHCWHGQLARVALNKAWLRLPIHQSVKLVSKIPPCSVQFGQIKYSRSVSADDMSLAPLCS